MRLVVATWNVHGWVGEGGKRNPAPAFEVMRRWDADLIALQEVEGDEWTSFAAEQGYEPILAHPGNLSFGNALLSRLPLDDVRQLDLSVPGRERRCALDVVVRLPGGEGLRLVSTHFGLRAGERRFQAGALARHLDERGSEGPLVLVGDFNDWTPWGRQLSPLSRAVGPFSRINTFPSRRPLLPLDRAAWRLPSGQTTLETERTPEVRRASDHLPLRLVVERDEAAEGSAREECP